MDVFDRRRDKLRAILKGMTQAELARASGVAASYISRNLKEPGDDGYKAIGEKTARNYERGAKKPEGWMDENQNSRPPTAVEPVHGGAGVPLISWVQAGTWAMVSDVFQPGEAEEWLPCPVRHGPRTYAVKVRGESMRNPDGRPSYNDGDILFVDPDRTANHGDRVIVRLDDQDEATFKQLLIEDGRKMLKALNPDWKPRYVEINGNATISGVVIGKWVPE